MVVTKARGDLDARDRRPRRAGAGTHGTAAQEGEKGHPAPPHDWGQQGLRPAKRQSGSVTGQAPPPAAGVSRFVRVRWGTAGARQAAVRVRAAGGSSPPHHWGTQAGIRTPTPHPPPTRHLHNRDAVTPAAGIMPRQRGVKAPRGHRTYDMMALLQRGRRRRPPGRRPAPTPRVRCPCIKRSGKTQRCAQSLHFLQGLVPRRAGPCPALSVPCVRTARGGVRGRRRRPPCFVWCRKGQSGVARCGGVGGGSSSSVRGGQGVRGERAEGPGERSNNRDSVV